ncbi:hypothetical protein G9A89_008694 [Geosiphon pyriformis]|nr:hypothetical protein G9A89_008694 [Geosiphon pyriformis]
MSSRRVSTTRSRSHSPHGRHRLSSRIQDIEERKNKSEKKHKGHKRRRDSDASQDGSDDQGKHAQASHLHISEDDYYSKSTEFRIWLREEKEKYFDEMSSDQTRRYFRRFVRAWNKSKLDKKYYEGIRSSQISSAESTRYKWKMNINQDELETVKNSVDRLTNIKFPTEVRARVGEGGGGGGGGGSSSVGVSVGDNDAPKEAKRRMIGPTMPPLQKYDEQEMDEEDRQRYERALRKKDYKDFQLTHETTLEELVPKATGREAMIEKRRARNAQFHREVSPNLEMNDKDLIGGDDFQSRLEMINRGREAREKRKDELRAEKAINLRDKVDAYQSKERQTLDMFKQMAEQQRKSGGGLWGNQMRDL